MDSFRCRRCFPWHRAPLRQQRMRSSRRLPRKQPDGLPHIVNCGILGLCEARATARERSGGRLMKQLFLPLAIALMAIPSLSRADLPPDVAKAVAAMGHKNDAAA